MSIHKSWNTGSGDEKLKHFKFTLLDGCRTFHIESMPSIPYRFCESSGKLGEMTEKINSLVQMCKWVFESNFHMWEHRRKLFIPKSEGWRPRK
jgi:hypothetical protein